MEYKDYYATLGVPRTASQADIKKEMQDALNQMVQAIINFLKEVKEAEANMMAAITRG